MIDKNLIEFAEKLQLPERVTDTNELPWIPYDDGQCHFKPLRFDFSTGTWTYLFKIKSGVELTKHRHTGGSVVGFNLQGTWYYEGRDWKAKPGTFIFEPPGDIHKLITEEGEDVITLFTLGGALQHFDEEDNITGQDDIFTVYKKYCDYCEENGLAVSEDLRY